MGCEQSVPVDNTNYTNNNQNSSTYSPPNVNNQSYAYYPTHRTNYCPAPQTNYYPASQSSSYPASQANYNPTPQSNYYPNQQNFIRQTQEDPVNYNPKPSAPPAYSNQIPYNSQLAYQQQMMMQQQVIPQYYVYQGTGQGINQVYYIPSNNAK